MRWFILLFCIFFCIGCETINKSRRLSYTRRHPELTNEQMDLLLKGKLWVGMTKDEVRASLGSPYQVQKDILGEKEVWSYLYKGQFTTHRKYAFDRALRLEFIEGRLADWQ